MKVPFIRFLGILFALGLATQGYSAELQERGLNSAGENGDQWFKL